MAICFFSWLVLRILVHVQYCSYGMHSKVEKTARVDGVGGMDNEENNGLSGEGVVLTIAIL